MPHKEHKGKMTWQKWHNIGNWILAPCETELRVRSCMSLPASLFVRSPATGVLTASSSAACKVILYIKKGQITDFLMS